LIARSQSPFVWSVIGAISATTSQKVTTGVTCPTVRIHPAIFAQAVATPAHLEAAAGFVTEEMVGDTHACGPDQEGFFDFYTREVRPRIEG